MNTTINPSTYIAALPVAHLFVDHEYQRELEPNRAKSMSLRWDPRLVGTLEVSDRGTEYQPRYAVINGQHRMQAAVLVDPSMSLPCTVHEGLSVEEEARLFWDIDRTTKKLNNWDRWIARRSAGDPEVAMIEAVCADLGLRVTRTPGLACLQCCSALEWVTNRCDLDTLREVLEFITDVWPHDEEARKATVIKALALVLHDYAGVVNTGRLADVLSDMTAIALINKGHELKSRGWDGGIAKLTQTAALMAYNQACRKDQKVELP